jgi:hypothetical protein
MGRSATRRPTSAIASPTSKGPARSRSSTTGRAPPRAAPPPDTRPSHDREGEVVPTREREAGHARRVPRAPSRRPALRAAAAAYHDQGDRPQGGGVHLLWPSGLSPERRARRLRRDREALRLLSHERTDGGRVRGRARGLRNEQGDDPLHSGQPALESPGAQAGESAHRRERGAETTGATGRRASGRGRRARQPARQAA